VFLVTVPSLKLNLYATKGDPQRLSRKQHLMLEPEWRWEVEERGEENGGGDGKEKPRAVGVG
jgi:hypothetical protein